MPQPDPPSQSCPCAASGSQRCQTSTSPDMGDCVLRMCMRSTSGSRFRIRIRSPSIHLNICPVAHLGWLEALELEVEWRLAKAITQLAENRECQLQALRSSQKPQSGTYVVAILDGERQVAGARERVEGLCCHQQGPDHEELEIVDEKGICIRNDVEGTCTHALTRTAGAARSGLSCAGRPRWSGRGCGAACQRHQWCCASTASACCPAASTQCCTSPVVSTRQGRLT